MKALESIDFSVAFLMFRGAFCSTLVWRKTVIRFLSKPLVQGVTFIVS